MQYDESSNIQISKRSAGIAIVDNDHRILLVREKKQSAAGLWHIPSGSVYTSEKHIVRNVQTQVVLNK